jgi:hypothetical protein
MSKFTATFEDGTTTARNSKKEYAAAWMVFYSNGKRGFGFSADATSAEKAARKIGNAGIAKGNGSYAVGSYRPYEITSNVNKG